MRSLRLLGLLLLLLALPGTAAAAVPRSFFGVNLDGPLLSDPAEGLTREAGLMRSSGIGSVRISMTWELVQPYPDLAAARAARGSAADRLPRDSAGIPIDFSFYDRVVGTLARRGLSPLGILVQAPRWARRFPDRVFSPPRDPRAYARFAATVVRRYGNGGSFWRANPRIPRRPITYWQVWNEQTDRVFWEDGTPPDSASGDRAYAALLRAAHPAIKRADRRGKVVLGGLFGLSWYDVTRYYDRYNLRGKFDVVALHPFTRQLNNVMKIVRETRIQMDNRRDRRVPILLTETTWPSAAGRIDRARLLGYEVSQAQQAKLATQLLTRLVRDRRRYNIAGMYWYNWATSDSGRTRPFFYAGLRRRSGVGRYTSKPVLRAFSSTARRLQR